jgi:hypothetical protein
MLLYIRIPVPFVKCYESRSALFFLIKIFYYYMLKKSVISVVLFIAIAFGMNYSLQLASTNSWFFIFGVIGFVLSIYAFYRLLLWICKKWINDITQKGDDYIERPPVIRIKDPASHK